MFRRRCARMLDGNRVVAKISAMINLAVSLWGSVHCRASRSRQVAVTSGSWHRLRSPRLRELDRSVAEQPNPLGVEVEQEQPDDKQQHVRPEILGVAHRLAARVPDLRGLRAVVTTGD